jgi:hypothetical protein
MSNLKYTAVRNEFCLVFSTESEIKEIDDDESIQSQAFHFRKISELPKMGTGRHVDVIGAVHECREL